MSTKKLQEKVQELVSLREMAAELADEIEALTDEIKADMDRQGVGTLETGKHTVRWAVVKSCRFDSKAFKTACFGRNNDQITTKTGNGEKENRQKPSIQAIS